MGEKIVSAVDADGYFVGPTIADESPLEPGVFLLPAYSVDIAPPVVPAGQRAKLAGKKFVFENLPVPDPAPPIVPPTDEEVAEAVRAKRQGAYMMESDPLFFKAQRGEATVEEWAAKVAEIKARYPDGVLPQ